MNEPTPYTVKDTGVKLLIKKVSPLLIFELNERFPEPKPPMQEIDIGGEMKQEPNYSHPDYLDSVSKYRKDMENKIRRLLIKFGASIPDDNITWKDELAKRRQEWKDEFDYELPHLSGNSEEVDWICYCALGTDNDFQELYEAITRRSMPTAEAIEAAKATFPG